MNATLAGLRTRWAAVGAAVAITLGAVGLGGLNIANADVSSGDRPVFIPIDPCRLVDTRPASAVGPKVSPLGPGETHAVTAHGANGECTGVSQIPSDAVGLALNVTAVGPTAVTFLTLWGDGANPGTSNLNPRPGSPPTPNAVNSPLSSTGNFNIYNDAGLVNVIVDVNGYYAHHDHDDRYALTGSDVTPLNVYALVYPESSNWGFEEVPAHTTSVPVECASMPLDVPAGRVVDSLSMSFIASAGADVRVYVIRATNVVGTFTAQDEIVIELVSGSLTALPPTPANSVDSKTFDASEIEVIDPAASYRASVCTQDEIAILGLSLATPLP